MSDLTIYTVAWICAIGTELVAAKQFLDETHDAADQLPANDDNAYVLGKVGKHNVVIAALPHGQYGLVSAAIVARDMARSFPNLRFALMVGIGGGAPSQRHDIRLGDIVVSSPGSGVGGVLQYDFGKTVQDESFKVTGHLNQSPQCLLRAIPLLEADYESEGNGIDTRIARILETKPRLRAKYRKPESSTDRLFSSVYKHAGDKDQDCTTVCDDAHLVKRPERSEEQDSPTIHYGTIASANQLIKDAKMRDKLSAEQDVLCFEMEAAGLMNHIPCLVIRGICDYSDTHKNKVWQGYAAMAAAAYAKDLLCKVALNKVEAERKLIELLSNVSNELSETKSQVMQARLILEKEEDLKVLNWLTPTDFGPQHSDYLRRRQPGTGQWLLDCEIYHKWVEKPGQRLLCPGIPGAGKTILSSIVIDNLESRFSADLTTVVAYVYCNFNRQAEQRLEHLISSLLKQLARNSPSLPPILHKLYEKHAKNGTRPTLEEMSTALATVTATFASVFIVVDALDECQVADNCRTRFLHQLFSVQTQQGVSIFATSRHMSDIEMEFSGGLTIEIRASEEDINKYLKSAISRLPRFVAERSDLQDEIAQTISQTVDGMFLLAQLYCDTFLDKDNPRVLRNALQGLANGSKNHNAAYKEAYDGAMERIEGQHKGQAKRAKQVLAWLTCAQRPLTKIELQHALAVEIGETKLDKENITQIHDIVPVCAGLITIDEASSVIRLVHYTTQKYFESTKNRWFPAAHSILADTCTTYLSFESFSDGRCLSDHEFEDRLKEHQFFEYAASYWGSHIRAAPSYEAVPAFLRKTAQIDASIQAHFTDRRLHYPGYSQRAPSGMVALHLAAIFGLPNMISMVWNERDQDAKDNAGRTPLSWAARNGYSKVVKLLLENKEVDVNAKDNHGQTPLLWTAENQYTGIVKLLLQAEEVDVNAKDNHGRTSLWLACKNRYSEVVKVLLEMKKVDVNAQDNHSQTPLWKAAEKGYSEVVKLLLETKKVDVDAKYRHGRTPLSWTAGNGYTEVVKMLLGTKEVDANAKDDYGRTPLSWTAGNGYSEVVKLLFETKEVEADAKDNYGQTPLWWAARNGHTEMVKLLLDNGAYIMAASKNGSTAIVSAAINGHLELAKFLLDNGADIMAASKGGETPIMGAALNGHLELAKFLLDNGADIMAASKGGETPITMAAENGHLDMVKLLLHNGANIMAANKSGHTSVIRAAEYGHLDMVRFLLENGADITATTKDGDTPLNAASRRGHTDVLRLLLMYGADSSVINKAGRSPLLSAARAGHKPAVELLIKSQPGLVNSSDTMGLTALSWAAKRDHADIINILLQGGADPGVLLDALDFAGLGAHNDVQVLLIAAGLGLPNDAFGLRALFECGSKDASPNIYEVEELEEAYGHLLGKTRSPRMLI